MKYFLNIVSTLILILLTTGVWATDNTFHQQVIAEYDNDLTYQANRQVEDIILAAWQDQHQQILMTGNLPRAIRLLNAPISGTTEHRGRNLLTFSAFSGFRKLASWALTKGAYINRGDKDNATMLRMSVANQLTYMVKFALENRAEPNWLQGDALENTIGDMMRFGWPIHGFELIWDYGARLKNQEQKEELTSYLRIRTGESWKEKTRLKYFLDRLESPSAILPEKAAYRSTPAKEIDIYMIGVMDTALIEAIKADDLAITDVKNFNVHGMPLTHYLTFNGMTQSLSHILETLPKSEAIAQANRRDRTGNDLITAAIKSLNVEALQVALTTSSSQINTMTPAFAGYYSQGKTPLHIAVQWQVPNEVFSLLFSYGASDSLVIPDTKHGLTPMGMLDKWYSKSPHYGRIKKALEAGKR